jgi:hypothetical protein
MICMREYSCVFARGYPNWDCGTPCGVRIRYYIEWNTQKASLPHWQLTGDKNVIRSMILELGGVELDSPGLCHARLIYFPHDLSLVFNKCQRKVFRSLGFAASLRSLLDEGLS